MTDLQSLRAMMEAATPGPWKIHDRAGTTVLASDGYSATNTESNMFDSNARNSANAALIVAAINALPRLLSIAEAYANAPIVHDVTGRHGFIGHHVRIVPCDAGGEPATGGRGE